MKGTPEYTRWSVAFPRARERFDHGVIEQIGVSFAARGGGTHGEFTISVHKFDNSFSPAPQFEVFADGMGAFLDARTQRAVKRMVRKCEHTLPGGHKRGISVDEIVDILNEEGFRPSRYDRREGW